MVLGPESGGELIVVRKNSHIFAVRRVVNKNSSVGVTSKV